MLFVNRTVVTPPWQACCRFPRKKRGVGDVSQSLCSSPSSVTRRAGWPSKVVGVWRKPGWVWYWAVGVREEGAARPLDSGTTHVLLVSPVYHEVQALKMCGQAHLDTAVQSHH